MTPIERKARELLPCPFCGGEAKRDDRTEYQSYSASESQSMGMGVSAGGFSSTTYAVQCDCGIRVQGNNDAFLIARWNRRTPAGEDARDAERWRYIAERAPTTIRLDGSMSNPEWAGLCPSYFRGNTADELDAAIDAARREG